jgi:hypothetical protein
MATDLIRLLTIDLMALAGLSLVLASRSASTIQMTRPSMSHSACLGYFFTSKRVMERVLAFVGAAALGAALLFMGFRLAGPIVTFAVSIVAIAALHFRYRAELIS